MSFFRNWEAALRKFETMDAIVIAAIQSHCIGGGLQVALACDLRVARDDARFGITAVQGGHHSGHRHVARRPPRRSRTRQAAGARRRRHRRGARRSSGASSTGSSPADGFEATDRRSHRRESWRWPDVDAAHEEADEHGVRDVLRRVRRDLLRVPASIDIESPEHQQVMADHRAARAPNAESGGSRRSCAMPRRPQATLRSSRSNVPAGTSFGACSSIGSPGRSGTPTTSVPRTARSATPPACTPTTCARSKTSRAFRSRRNRISGTATRSACSRCRGSRSSACTPRAARPASRPSSATPPRDIDTWASLMARSIRAAGGRPGDIVHVAYGYGLFTGGLGRALRRREAGVHGHADVRRSDREAGAADRRLRARRHHGDAVLHAEHRRGVRPPGTRSAHVLARDRHLRRRAVDRGDAQPTSSSVSISTPSTSTGCRK